VEGDGGGSRRWATCDITDGDDAAGEGEVDAEADGVGDGVGCRGAAGTDMVQETGKIASAGFKGAHGGEIEVGVSVDEPGKEEGRAAVESAVRTAGEEGIGLGGWEESESEVGAEGIDAGTEEWRGTGTEVEDGGGGGEKDASLVGDGGDVEAEDSWGGVEHSGIVASGGVRSIEMVNSCECRGRGPMIAWRGVG
jgi:hypothetical protein